VSVDGKPAVGAIVTGSSPNYSWSANVTKLAKGPHTLKATFFLGGVEKASRSVAFTAK
jgi:hypothetical protein